MLLTPGYCHSNTGICTTYNAEGGEVTNVIVGMDSEH